MADTAPDWRQGLASVLREHWGGPLAVAVTGHRWNKISPQAEPQLVRALEEIFAALDRAAGAAVTLLTGMAEGADLASVQACPLAWRLLALLPLPPDAWRAHLLAHAEGDRAKAAQTFEAAIMRPGTEAVVLPAGEGGKADFSGLAAALAERADLLVAVWDGKAGKPGGTAEVVALARERGVPVLHLPACRATIGEPRWLASGGRTR